jgi:hypothetical protein
LNKLEIKPIFRTRGAENRFVFRVLSRNFRQSAIQ